MRSKKRPPAHPGETLLKEFLEPMGATQLELARHLKWPYARLNEIIHGKRGITADSALAFGEAFKTSPEFWLDLQRDWDIWRAKQRHVKHAPLRKAAEAAV